MYLSEIRYETNRCTSTARLWTGEDLRIRAALDDMRILEFLGLLLMKRARISDLGLHQQTSLVQLWRIDHTTRPSVCCRVTTKFENFRRLVLGCSRVQGDPAHCAGIRDAYPLEHFFPPAMRMTSSIELNSIRIPLTFSSNLARNFMSQAFDPARLQ